jgi:cell division protein FtsL
LLLGLVFNGHRQSKKNLLPARILKEEDVMDGVRQLTQAYSQTPWRRQLQLLGLFLLFVVLAALVAGIYLNVTARAGTLGREVQIMQDRIEELQLQNADLETRLAMVNSAAEMEKRALDMGFTPLERDEVTYIVVPGYISRQQAVIAPPPKPKTIVPASLPSDYTESLLVWLQENLLPALIRFLEVQP